MGIQFSYPWLLALLVPWLGCCYWMWKQTLRLGGLRKKIAVGLRALIMLLLILALAGMQLLLPIVSTAVFFVADVSDSMPDDHPYLQWMKEAGQHKEDPDRIGVIATGLEAAVERNADMRNLDDFSFAAPVNKQYSNVESGLSLAAGLLPNDAEPRIVLVSDGLDNVGDMLRHAKLLKDKGIPVDVLPIPQKRLQDASVVSVKVPEKLYQAEKYSLEIEIFSTHAANGELRIYEDNREISSQPVELNGGENRFVLQSLAKEPGFHRYRAELYVSGDEQPANNAGYAFSRVAGPPKVLLVEAAPGDARNVAAILQAGLIPYDAVQPEMLPQEFVDYTAYESIILHNVPATRISQTQMEMIEQAVRDYGIGLMMVGGEDSYGLGGYFKTPIERALPVYMDLRGKRQIPSLGLMLVIDKSGSMSGEKIRLAQEAATRTVELMRPRDTIGVLAFDSSPWWVVEPQPLTDSRKVVRQINSIAADGGTEIYTAVEQAYERLLEVDAERKHIILLTDGQSATNQSYEALAEQMVENNMTLSSVAIGEGADTQLLEQIAKWANGRYYFTNDESTVPAIFSREAVLIARTYIVDQPFVPSFGQGADWSVLFRQGMPGINAYIATTPKETAEVNLMSPEPDPLLARWQYGSGRAVAWTSDLTGKWSANWLQWEQFPHIFSQIVKWTFPQFNASPLELISRANGDEVTFDVTSSVPNFAGNLQATVTDENLQSEKVELTPTVPGEYSGRMNVRQPGVYVTKIDALDPDDPAKTIGSVTTGFVIPYSPEYEITDQDGGERLKRLAETTGGRILSLERPEDVFAVQAESRKQSFDLARYLLMTALILWICDIAVRRLSLSAASLRNALSRRISAQEAGGSSASSPSSAPALDRLKQRKRKIADFLDHSADTADSRPLRPASAEERPKPRTEEQLFGLPPEARRETPDSAKPTEPGQPEADGSAARPDDTEGDDPMSRLLRAKNRSRR